MCVRCIILLLMSQDSQFWVIANDIADVAAQPVATVTAGVIVGIGAWLGFKSSRDARISAERLAHNRNVLDENQFRRNHRREVMVDRQKRLTTIAEQLSSTNEPSRLAGIYSLSALADEWQVDGEEGLRDVAIDIMCAYLRKAVKDGEFSGDRQVRAAAAGEIKKHIVQDAPLKWPGNKINLSGALLMATNFDDCNFPGADLARAAFAQASVKRANFEGAQLSRTSFTSARAQGASFRNTRLRGCSLRRAELQDTYFSGATLMPLKVPVRGGVTHLTYIRGANFSGADLRGTAFIDVDLQDPADASEVFFTETRTISTDSGQAIEYVKAICDRKTILPPGFKAEALEFRSNEA
jgi:uncharacterized protein YjbI with pentapeptide repeats